VESETASTLETLRAALGTRVPRRYPRVRGLVRAAVAVVLVPSPEGFGTVLIGRPVRASDRWSGDVAFPGGLARPHELDVETARREAEEEVGLRLGEPLTRLSDRLSLAPGRTRPMRVRPIVFVHEGALDLRPDPREVAMVELAQLRTLASAERVPMVRRIGPMRPSFPSIPIGEHVLWGLTLSVLDELFLLMRVRPNA
jgi:8-oxo-dGTP pyrophosphatase MutT (NUDIX family)